MTLRELVTSSLSTVDPFSPENLGESLLYNGVEVHAIFTPLVDPQTSRGGSASTATLQLQVSEVPTWAVGDEVVQDGATWKVKREGPGGTWYKHVLQIERDRRMKP